MRVNSIERQDSDEDSFNYLNNMTINNITRDEESDVDNEKTLNYFQNKISSLEDSFVKVRKIKKDQTLLDFTKRDKEFLTDLIKTLFKEINQITDNYSKQIRKINTKTEKIKKLNSIQKEICEKYLQIKMNYKSVIKETEYKEKQIRDLENLIKACDLEIFSLQSRISEMTNFFHLNNNNKISSWAFSSDANSLLKKIIEDFENKKSILDDMNKQLNYEKEGLNNIVDNLRNNITKKDITITELKQELMLKNTQINELNDKIDRLKMDVDRCKIKLESEKKSNQFHVDKLKYLTESIRRKEENESEDKMDDFENGDNLANELKFYKKGYKKRYKSCINLDEIMDDIEKDNNRDFSCRKKISFIQSNEINNQKNQSHTSLAILNNNQDPNRKEYKKSSGFILSPTKEEPNETFCLTRISENNLANTIMADQSQISRPRNKSKQFDEDKFQSDRSKINSKEEVPTLKEEENALGLIMSINSETNSDEKQNLSRCLFRKISKISVTSSIDFVENGLKNTKNRLTSKNILDVTNEMLQIQQVHNISIYSGRKKSTKGIKVNSNNYNNIININFNNYKTYDNPQTKDSNVDLNAINTNFFSTIDEKNLKIFFDFLYETMRYKKNGLQLQFSNDNSNANQNDKEELFKCLLKEKIQFYNFSEFIQKHLNKKSRCSNDLNVTVQKEVEDNSPSKQSDDNPVNIIHCKKYHTKYRDLYINSLKKKILYLKNKIFEIQNKNLLDSNTSKTININDKNLKINPEPLNHLKIQNKEMNFQINSTNETRASINSFSNLKTQSFNIYTLNSSLHINSNSSEKNKQPLEQPYSDGLKSLYMKYFKYSDNFLKDTMKNQSQINNFNHLYPNSKWNKYIASHNQINNEKNNQLVKYIKPSSNTSQIVKPIISQKNSQTSKILNFMHTQYYYNMYLNKKHWSKD